MSQEENVSKPEGEDGFEPLVEGDASLEALGGTGIELIHNSVTPMTADMA
jgi:hypothetical protein